MDRKPLHKQFAHIRREELPFALLMSGYFFLVITSFWILKPIKKTLFIGHYDEEGFALVLSGLFNVQLLASQAELLAKVLNMVIAALAVIAFTLLARRLRREQLTYILTAFFMAAYVCFTFFVPQPGDGTVWTFYLFGDLFSTLMVATFFAFLNDSVTPEAAKRLYGLVVLGGVIGGAFGSLFVNGYINTLPTATWLWICFGLGGLILLLAFSAGRLVPRPSQPDAPPAVRDDGRSAPSPKRSNAALEGARLVFRSRYLLSIAAIVGIYEVVSTVLDFQTTATIAHYLNGDALDQQFTRVYAIMNGLALFVQLFLTSFVMTRFSVMTALLITPAIIMLSSGAFLAVPALWFGSALIISDGGFNYSINQSAREALYTITSRDEKYKAKAFIDMFVQRFAKAVAVGVSLAITLLFTDFSTIRWLSLFTLALVATWALAARYAGRRFKQHALTDSDTGNGVASPNVARDNALQEASTPS